MGPPIAIDANHFARLSPLSLLTSGPMVEVSEYLREELDRAHILPAEKLRSDIVNLDSLVEFRDQQTGKIQEIVLVYPIDADIAHRRVSVSTPVGAALLGLSVNQTISFHTSAGEISRTEGAQGHTRDLANRRGTVVALRHLSYPSAIVGLGLPCSSSTQKNVPQDNSVVVSFIMRRKNERNPASFSERAQFVEPLAVPMDLFRVTASEFLPAIEIMAEPPP